MDELEILMLISDGQRHTVNELIEGRRITGIELMMIAQGMKHKGWIEFTTEARKPWLQILPPGEQAVAAHRQWLSRRSRWILKRTNRTRLIF
jgi:DNA-binding MarR family transcriptional regulator